MSSLQQVSRSADKLGLLNRFNIPVIYLNDDTTLKINTRNSNASLTGIDLHARSMKFNGEVADEHFEIPITTSDRSLESDLINSLRNCYLACLDLSPMDNNKYGQTFLEVIIHNNRLNLDVCTILSGYVESARTLATGLLSGTLERTINTADGYLRIVVGTNPAAGADMSESVPTNARWSFVSMRITLVTDATVANRMAKFDFDDGTNVFATVLNATSITAGSTCNITVGGGGDTANDTGNDHIVACNEVPLMAGFRINSRIKNLQAGDNLGAPVILVKERIEE